MIRQISEVFGCRNLTSANLFGDRIWNFKKKYQRRISSCKRRFSNVPGNKISALRNNIWATHRTSSRSSQSTSAREKFIINIQCNVNTSKAKCMRPGRTIKKCKKNELRLANLTDCLRLTLTMYCISSWKRFIDHTEW